MPIVESVLGLQSYKKKQKQTTMDEIISESSNESIPLPIVIQSPQNSYKLLCSDGEVLVYKESAKHSKLLVSMTEDASNEEEDDDYVQIPVANITVQTMNLVAKFMDAYNAYPFAEIKAPLSKTDATSYLSRPDKFKEFNEIDLDNFAELIQAADYLDFQPMLTYLLAQFSIKLRDLGPSEIVKFFQVEDGFTEEEEERVREENSNYVKGHFY